MVKQEVATLWIDGPLSYLEILCLLSYEKVGQKITLFTYGNVPNVPDSINVRDAREIDDDDTYELHKKENSPALKSDAFRYKMLQSTDFMWVDADQMALKPFDYTCEYVFAESWGLVNNAVLKLPRKSEIVRDLVSFSREKYPIPFWLDDEQKQILIDKKAAGSPVPAIDMEFGIYGPQLLGHLLIKYDLIKYTLPANSFNPFPPRFVKSLWKAAYEEADGKFIRPWTRGIHFWGHMYKKFYAGKGAPPVESVMGRLLREHEINADVFPMLSAKS